jgi:hypothetical protein
VRKLVLGFFDSGRFDLKIDGNTYATAVRSGGSTGAVEVPGGPHTVSETGAGATSLGNYHSTVLCYQRGGGFVGYGFSPSLTINVLPGQDVVCTIVNQRSFSWFWWR